MITSDMRDFVLRSSKREISEKRVELLRDIDDEIFYPLSMWPKRMERLFWKKWLSANPNRTLDRIFDILEQK